MDDESILQPVPVLIGRGDLRTHPCSICLKVLETHLGEVGIRLSSVVKGMSQVLHLIGSIGIGIGIGEQEEKGQKDEVDRELAKDRPHLDLFQSLSSCPGHFAIVETSGACHRGSSAERRLHLKYPSPLVSLSISSNKPDHDADTLRPHPVPHDRRRHR